MVDLKAVAFADQERREQRRRAAEVGLEMRFATPVRPEYLAPFVRAGPRGFAELVARVARRGGTTKELARALIRLAGREVLAIVARDGRLCVPGFGTFSERTRKARAIAHPTTKEPMQLPATRTVGFRLAKRAKYGRKVRAPRRAKR